MKEKLLQATEDFDNNLGPIISRDAAYSIADAVKNEDHDFKPLQKLSKLMDEATHLEHKMEHVQEQVMELLREDSFTDIIFTGPEEEGGLVGCLMGAPLTQEPHAVLKPEWKAQIAEWSQEKSQGYFAWILEFLDLILVANIVKASDQLLNLVTQYLVSEHLEYEEHRWDIITAFIQTFCVVFVFYCLFLEHMLIYRTFDDLPGFTDDLLHTFYGTGITLMGMSIPKSEGEHEGHEIEVPLQIFDHKPAFKGFLFGYDFVLGCLIIMYFIYWRIYPQHIAGSQQRHPANVYCVRRIFTMVTAFFISLLTLAVDESWKKAVIFAASAFPIYVMELNGLRASSLYNNPHTEYLTERFGVFTMIMLGESIMSIILVDLEFDSDKKLWSSMIVGATSFLGSFLLFFIYFRGNNAIGGEHAIDNHLFPGGLVWIGCHFPLACVLVTHSIGLKYSVILSGKEEDNIHERELAFVGWIHCFATGTFCALVWALRLGHDHIRWHWVYSWWRFVIFALYVVLMVLYCYNEEISTKATTINIVWLIGQTLITIVDVKLLEYETDENSETYKKIISQDTSFVKTANTPSVDFS